MTFRKYPVFELVWERSRVQEYRKRRMRFSETHLDSSRIIVRLICLHVGRNHFVRPVMIHTSASKHMDALNDNAMNTQPTVVNYCFMSPPCLYPSISCHLSAIHYHREMRWCSKHRGGGGFSNRPSSVLHQGQSNIQELTRTAKQISIALVRVLENLIQETNYQSRGKEIVRQPISKCENSDCPWMHPKWEFKAAPACSVGVTWHTNIILLKINTFPAKWL